MAKTTQTERDQNESRNISVVANFKNHWADKGLDLHSIDIGLHFKAQISYSSPKHSTLERANVRIHLSGYGTDGMIDIDETSTMSVEEFHLRMMASFGTYKLNSATGELIVSNESPKMGGKYSIRILPIGAPD